MDSCSLTLQPEMAQPLLSQEPRSRVRQRRRWMVWLVVAGLMAGLFVLLRERSASDTFTEGVYSEPPAYGMLHEITFQEGRFVQSSFGGTTPTPDAHGVYTVRRDEIQLVYDDRAIVPAVVILTYRKIGGVGVLLSPGALVSFEKNAALPEFSMQIDDSTFHSYYARERSSRWYRMVKEHPDFAAALPPQLREGYKLPLSLYLRFRWSDFMEDHPTLKKNLPKRLSDP